MATKTLTPTNFREEAGRRLIDTFELALALGLRSRQSVQARVEAGSLPPPVYSKRHLVSLWDRDEIPELAEGQ